MISGINLKQREIFTLNLHPDISDAFLFLKLGCRTSLKKMSIQVFIMQEEGDDLAIGEILRTKQPDIYKKLKKFSNTNKKSKIKKEEYIDFKRLMEDAPVYKRHCGALRQVRYN